MYCHWQQESKISKKEILLDSGSTALSLVQNRAVQNILWAIFDSCCQRLYESECKSEGKIKREREHARESDRGRERARERASERERARRRGRGREGGRESEREREGGEGGEERGIEIKLARGDRERESLSCVCV